MKAKEVMTAPVVTVTPDMGLHHIVTILLEHRISGVLVVDEGKVVGVVGDGDLIHRYEIGTDTWTAYRTWWQRLTQADPAPVAYIKSHGGHARDVMSRDVVSVSEDAPVARLAAIFEARHIRRVPVLRDGQLVGLVTRADLVRALAASATAMTPPQARTDDEAIRVQLLKELDKQPWWSGSWSNVFVHHGVVSYIGVFRREADKEAARIAAENIPGVRGVEDRRIPYDDGLSMI
ncbi:MAG: CBS domain-containing protein [Polaromonas sp.]